MKRQVSVRTLSQQCARLWLAVWDYVVRREVRSGDRVQNFTRCTVKGAVRLDTL